jgi:hypothetical protein
MFSAKFCATLITFALVSVSANSQEPLPISLVASSTSAAISASAPSTLPLAPSPAPSSPYVTLTPHTRIKTREQVTYRPFSTFAFGLKTSTLGAGVEVATPVARAFNLRAGINYARFNTPFQIDGIYYNTGANYRSAQLTLDWFPRHGGFHVSTGALYLQNGLYGNASIPAAQHFTLNDINYINSVDDPVGGAASFVYTRHLAPVVLVGFTNIVPRDRTRFSVPFEVGLAYTGAPTLNVNLLGTACTVQGCFNAATDPGTKKSLLGELKDVDDKVRLAIAYPVVSLGFAYRF